MEKMTFKLYKYLLFARGFVIAQLTISIVTLFQQIAQYQEMYGFDPYYASYMQEFIEMYFKTFLSPMIISTFVLLAISVILYYTEFKITKAYRKRKLTMSERLNEHIELEKPIVIK